MPCSTYKETGSTLNRLTQMHPDATQNAGTTAALNLMASMSSGSPNWWSWGVLTTGQWALQPSTNFGGSTGIFIDRIGNLGIGTTTTGSFKLAVEGKIGAREVNVTSTSPWPDYVFSADHKLPSLETIERYIQQHKHLPDVPTAKEIEGKGLDIGEMNALLLKKIEELTLYVIDQQKQIDELKAKIK